MTVKPVCTWDIERSPRHPVADLKCGAPVKFVIVDKNSARCGELVCGRHANSCAVRNIKVEPIKGAQ